MSTHHARGTRSKIVLKANLGGTTLGSSAVSADRNASINNQGAGPIFVRKSQIKRIDGVKGDDMREDSTD